MELEEKVRAVEAVFERLDADIAAFQTESGLGCKWGCGKCCFKADIEATVLEFLPFASYLHKNGLALEWLERLSASDDPICLILNPLQNGAGMCSEYRYRGLICRLFGFSARTNKYGSKELVTCQVIKTEQQAQYEAASSRVAQGGNIPVMNQYYMQLHGIDFQMAQEFFPINEAIKRALEVILHYYAYRS
jgi:Fe-S-cluster containining protein